MLCLLMTNRKSAENVARDMHRWKWCDAFYIVSKKSPADTDQSGSVLLFLDLPGEWTNKVIEICEEINDVWLSQTFVGESVWWLPSLFSAEVKKSNENNDKIT